MKTKKILRTGKPAHAPRHREPNLGQRILVVEDDATIRRVNTEALTCSGYQVDAAENGAVAWDAVQRNNYDLVVTDNQMPKVTGVELIQKLQAARMPLPVIMVTAAMPAEEFTRHRLQPPAMTLLKPHTFIELLVAVKKVLRAAGATFGKIAPPPHQQVPPLAGRFQQ
jgi:DNA-binding response OmpR family regulator